MLYQQNYGGDTQGILLHRLDFDEINWQEDQTDQSSKEPEKLEFLKLLKIHHCSGFDFLDECTMVGVTHGDTLYKYTRENPYSLDWVLDSTKSLNLTMRVTCIDDNIYTTSWN